MKCSDTQNHGQLSVANQHHAHNFKENGHLFRYYISAHITFLCTRAVHPSSITVACTNLDTVSRPELFNVSLVVSLCLLQITAATIHVQKFLYIIRSSNLYATLPSFQILSMQKHHSIASNVVRGRYSHKQCTIKHTTFFA